jgi:ubiquinone/menaquinone biosynthesis C-methylase UbiE
VGRLGAMFAASAKELAGRVPASAKRILDVGCGSGIWSLSIAARSSDARVTGLDFPAVLQSFRAKAKELELTDRIDVIEGDVHAVDAPKGAFDLVVVANVLRLETPDRAKRILERIAPAVAEGGALLVIDALGEGTPEKERARSIYALHLGMRTEQGSVHAPSTIRGWLASVGLGRVESIDVATNPGAVGALLARA